MSNDPIGSLLGIAAKGRNVVSGEFSTEEAVKKHRAFLVIIANDASDNTKKSFSNMCEFYHVPIFFYADKDTLGRFIGCEMRAGVAVTDQGLAQALIKKLQDRD